MLKTKGRPTSYRPEMLAIVLEKFSEGASRVEVSVALGISNDTFGEWCKDGGDYFIPEFSASVKRGLELAEAWWMQTARDHVVDNPGQGKLNTALWFINMKNRFGWRDQVDYKHSGNVTVTHEQALDALIGDEKRSNAATTHH